VNTETKTPRYFIYNPLTGVKYAESMQGKYLTTDKQFQGVLWRFNPWSGRARSLMEIRNNTDKMNTYANYMIPSSLAPSFNARDDAAKTLADDIEAWRVNGDATYLARCVANAAKTLAGGSHG
jgi:hypothetical protein